MLYIVRFEDNSLKGWDWVLKSVPRPLEPYLMNSFLPVFMPCPPPSLCSPHHHSPLCSFSKLVFFLSIIALCSSLVTSPISHPCRVNLRLCHPPAVIHSRVVVAAVAQMTWWCYFRPMNDMQRRAGHATHLTVTQMTVQMRQPRGKMQQPDLPLQALPQPLVPSPRVSVKTDFSFSVPWFHECFSFNLVSYF